MKWVKVGKHLGFTFMDKMDDRYAYFIRTSTALFVGFFVALVALMTSWRFTATVAPSLGIGMCEIPKNGS